MSSKPGYTLSAVIILSFVIASAWIPPRSSAQTRPVIVAPGWAFNLFADPSKVPEFALSAYTGPVSMAFDSRGRLFVGTLSGKILILLDNDGDGVVDQVKTFASGLAQPLGLELRADGDLFATSNVLGGAGRIIRLRDVDGDDVAEERTTIIDGLPSEGDHQTDRLKFGPDGLLYFGQGSSTDDGVPKASRPDERPLNATVLRIDVEAPMPEIFARGLRNPFGMAFHPDSGELFTTDGGSGELCQLGPCPPDTSPPEEVNWVVKDGNYGFPKCEGTPVASNPDCAGVRAPVQQFPAHLTPTSLAFYTGPQAAELKNQLLLTLYKRVAGIGGDLRRLKIEGDAASGFRVTEVQVIADFGIIDPFDGPVETAIDPISGDIYVARFDPVTHRNPNEHHHFIYRLHRAGSDAQTFIGPIRPSKLTLRDDAAIGDATVSVIGRRLKPGAAVFNATDDVELRTSPGPNSFELMAVLPASMLSAGTRTIMLEVRNPDQTRSNQQPLAVTIEQTGPPPPVLESMVVYRKKPANVVNPVIAGSNAKKLRLSVSGTRFDAGAQVLANGVSLELLSSSGTELVGRLTNSLIASPGEITVQVRNASGKISNALKLVVAPAQ